MFTVVLHKCLQIFSISTHTMNPSYFIVSKAAFEKHRAFLKKKYYIGEIYILYLALIAQFKSEISLLVEKVDFFFLI